MPVSRCRTERSARFWLAGGHVCQGYWQRPELSEATFRARLADGQGPYLRTGDLGFMADGELFVTGRRKDVIIVRGANYYPEDIELTLGSLSEAIDGTEAPLNPAACAAFAVDVEGEERLVVAIELNRHYQRDLQRALERGDTNSLQFPPDRLVRQLRQVVAERHELAVHDVVLLKVGRLPRTSSGKVQRHRCRLGL